MMKRKYFLLVCLAALLAPIALRAEDSSSTSPASGPGTHRRRFDPGERLQKMKETLGLTDEQTAKIKAIMEKNRGKFAGLKDLKPEERRAKAREIVKNEMEEIAPILTPEQKAKWKEQVQKRRNQQSSGTQSKV